MLASMWKSVVGKAPSRTVLESTMESYSREAGDASYLTFEECQNALLQELQETGAVPILTPMYVQMRVLRVNCSWWLGNC